MQPRFVSSLASLSWYASFSLKHCISPLTFYLILIFPVIIKITIYYKKNFIPLIIANSQKLPRRFYETKKVRTFFTLSGHHNEKAIKHTHNWRNQHD